MTQVDQPQTITQKSSGGTGLKVVTALSLVAAIGAGVFGYQQYQQNQNNSSSDAATIAELQKQYNSVEKKLNLDNTDIAKKSQELKSLSEKYNMAVQNAKAQETNLDAQLAAAQAKSSLASQCADIMATGLTKIYNDNQPTKAMQEIVQVIDDAASSCKGVVNLQPILL